MDDELTTEDLAYIKQYGLSAWSRAVSQLMPLQPVKRSREYKQMLEKNKPFKVQEKTVQLEAAEA